MSPEEQGRTEIENMEDGEGGSGGGAPTANGGGAATTAAADTATMMASVITNQLDIVYLYREFTSFIGIF